jgi:hypothetical protein
VERNASLVIGVTAALIGVMFLLAENGFSWLAFSLGLFAAAAVLAGWRDFASLSMGGRLILACFVLRPVVDSFGSGGAPVSGITVQQAFAGALLVILVAARFREKAAWHFLSLPHLAVWVLLGMSVVAWISGGIHQGSELFLRTIWGLLVLLLLGDIYVTEEQARVFVLTIFFSSTLFLLVLLDSMRGGDYIGEFRRLGGQFAVPATLAGVTLALFSYGLFAVHTLRKRVASILAWTLLICLTVAVVLSQSKTVALVTILSIAIWLWINQRRKLLVALALLGFASVLLYSQTLEQWRPAAALLGAGEAREELVTLTGRTLVWGTHVETFAQAGWIGKLLGIGWGATVQNFLTLGLDFSSVTESSYLWFLVGGGMLSLLFFLVLLMWMLLRSWNRWRFAPSQNRRALSALCFIATFGFALEALTTDVVLSPVVSGYHFAIMSIVMAQVAHEQRKPPLYD